jgi:hypothetical protein
VRGIRKWLVPFLIVASIGLVTAATDSGAVDLPPSDAHFFKPDADGLVVNRRPTNISFLATGADVSLVEDTVDATVGYDQGFLTQPLDATTQTVRRIVQVPPADAAGETVATASGFFSSFESPDLVVLRGDSRRWSGDFDPNSTDPTMSLTWYGPQSGAFSTPKSFDLSGVQGRPVGVTIVSGTLGDGSVLKEQGNVAVLATTRGVYAFAPRGCALYTDFCLTAEKEVGPLPGDGWPEGTSVLAVQHNPVARLSAIEEFDEEFDGVNTANGAAGKNVLDMFGVLLSRPVDGQPGKRLLSTEFLRVQDAVSLTPSIGEAVPWDPKIVTPGDFINGVPRGGDLRFGIGNNGFARGDNGPGHDVRVDINVTLADRTTRQYTGARMNPEWTIPIVPTEKLAGGIEPVCATPATGFDAAYFDAFSGPARRLEAHVQCAAPFYYNFDFNGQITRLRKVIVSGYRTTGATIPDGDNAGDAGIVRNGFRDLPLPAGLKPIRPQVAVSLPCVELTRYALRQEHRSETADFSWPKVKAQLESDRAFITSKTDWPKNHQCSAGPVDQGVFPYPRAGNEEVSVLVHTAPDPEPSVDASLAPIRQATVTSLATVGVNTAPPPEPYVDYVTSQPMPVGTFLTRLPNTDTIERVRLIDGSATCLTTASDADKLECRPATRFGAPVPIAVMVTPPFLKGSEQRGEITSEFATSATSTQEQTESTSTSVGIEVELGEKVVFQDPITKVTASAKLSVAAGYDRTGEHETSKALTVTKSNGYGGSFEEDTIVVNLARYLSYKGVLERSSNGIGLCDRPDTSSACEPAETRLGVPVGNVVTSMTVNDLQADPTTAAWWKAPGAFGVGLADTLRHVPGNPDTYLANDLPLGDPNAANDAINEYCIGDIDPSQGFAEVAEGSPTPANPFTSTPEIAESAPQILTSDWRAATAGTGVTSQRANLEFSSERGESFLQTNSISASVSVEGEFGAGGFTDSAKVTVSAGGSWGDGYSASLGEGTTFSGTVGSIPDPNDSFKDEQFTWRMFVCKRELVPGVPVWVQNYEVIGYNGVYSSPGVKDPEELGPVEATSPVQSHVTSVTPTFEWSQPQGTVRNYDLDVEAIGATDQRKLTPPDLVYPDFPTASARLPVNTYTLPATESLLPGQLYRWRAVSTNFFDNTETSEWQYFVTEGPQRLSVGDASVVEGTSSSRAARFTVSLSAPMSQDVYFKYGTLPGTAMPVDTPAGPADFTHTTGTGVIDAGSTSTSVSVPIRGDSVVEAPEVFYLALSPVSPVAILKPVGIGTILADDPARGAGVSVGDASVVEGKTGDRFLRFTVSRHSRKADPVSVSYLTGPWSATAGSDFTAGSGTVTINANATSAVIRIPVKGDTARESHETMWVWLTSPTGGAMYRPVGFGTILDDD